MSNNGTTTTEPGMPILIHIGNRELELRFSLRALRELQKTTRVKLLGATQDLQEILRDADFMSAALYYGTRDYNTDITREWIDDQFDAPTWVQILPQMIQAIFGKTPAELAQQSAPNGDRPADQIGSLSGPSGDTTSDSVSTTSGN